MNNSNRLNMISVPKIDLDITCSNSSPKIKTITVYATLYQYNTGWVTPSSFPSEYTPLYLETTPVIFDPLRTLLYSV